MDDRELAQRLDDLKQELAEHKELLNDILDILEQDTEEQDEPPTLPEPIETDFIEDEKGNVHDNKKTQATITQQERTGEAERALLTKQGEQLEKQTNATIAKTMLPVSQPKSSIPAIEVKIAMV